LTGGGGGGSFSSIYDALPPTLRRPQFGLEGELPITRLQASDERNLANFKGLLRRLLNNRPQMCITLLLRTR
jgi:hypothetical protein